MAKIVYYHHKDPSKEMEDIANNWWTCPPSLEGLTKKQEELLSKVWRMGNYGYLDPLGYTQCLYAMLRDIPFGRLIMKFIKKEHQYKEFN